MVDGDTVKVERLSGPAPDREVTVRLIGIDTPETVRPGTAVECGGREATSTMYSLSFGSPADTDGDGLFDSRAAKTVGRDVVVTTDPTQDLHDPYGRLLAYVEPAGGDLGLRILRSGWASVYVFRRDFRHLRSYESAEEAAFANALGIWGACGGDPHAPLTAR